MFLYRSKISKCFGFGIKDRPLFSKLICGVNKVLGFGQVNNFTFIFIIRWLSQKVQLKIVMDSIILRLLQRPPCQVLFCFVLMVVSLRFSLLVFFLFGFLKLFLSCLFEFFAQACRLFHCIRAFVSHSVLSSIASVHLFPTVC